MPYQYAHLMNLTANQLHNDLMRRDIPPEHRENIKAIIAQQKATIKSERAKAIKVKAEWQPLLEGLRMERESLRSMRNYAMKESVGDSVSPTQAKLTAIEAYSMVLDRLKQEFEEHVIKRETPAVISKQRNLPNGGIHWSDWVKDRHKERVSALFAEIPPAPRAKTKTPFLRTTAAKSNERLLARLRRRTIKEHGIAVQNHEINPSERSKAKLSKLEEALRRIDKLQPTDPVPRTWSGLFVTEGEER
jgi:hypothetical protein